MSAGLQNRIRVLIAEDSPLCQKLVQTALTNQPYEVHFAANGHEALRLFEAERPDILIADWMIPPPSGLELCREVRKRAGRYTYVILITSKSQKDNLIEGLDAGADDYVTNRSMRVNYSLGFAWEVELSR